MYDPEGYYVIQPDPDTLPDPYFEGMCWEEICRELDRLEYEAAEQAYWERQMDEAYMQEYWRGYGNYGY